MNTERQAASSWADLGSFISEGLFHDGIRVPPEPLEVLPVTTAMLALAPKPSLRAVWIGHASVYIELDGLRILLDPVFSEYASPFEFGPRRFHPPPIALDDLPAIDAVLISHDHYDHLDMATVRELEHHGAEGRYQHRHAVGSRHGQPRPAGSRGRRPARRRSRRSCPGPAA